MAMKRCEQGHYYDTEKHTSCPVCGVGIEIERTTPATGGKNPAGIAADGIQVAPTRPVGHSADKGSGKIEIKPTQPVRRAKNQQYDPVVGWLVCIAGADKGRDFRVHSDRNYIGRDPNMDICIHGDDTVSAKNHVVVSYNPRNGSFTIIPGEGRNIVYINDEELLTPQILEAYDKVEVGKTKLMFVPFCGDSFSWDTE